MRMNGLSAKTKTKIGKLSFYICLIILPLLQFLLFYLYVNINSFILAFQNYDVFTNTASFAGWDNFRKIYTELIEPGKFEVMLKNSLTVWLWSTVLGIVGAILFSYYIYKQGPLSNLFRTILYMPHVISTVVLVVMFKYFSEWGIPAIYESITGRLIDGLYSNPDTAFPTVVFYSLWMGFGTQVLMYVSTMAGIDVSISEAAKIDGITYIKEFWYITLPLVFPTLTTFILTGIAGIFTNQANLFSFGSTGVSGDMQTIGYYMYKELQINATNKTAWPMLSAMGLLFTFIVAPITFLVRWALEKYGPRVD